MLLSIALHCNFLCEQPMGSSDVFPNHPRLSWLCNKVAVVAGLLAACMCCLKNGMSVNGQHVHTQSSRIRYEVWRNNFWMLHHGAKCPKRTTVWSVQRCLVLGLAPPLKTCSVCSFMNPVVIMPCNPG